MLFFFYCSACTIFVNLLMWYMYCNRVILYTIYFTTSYYLESVSHTYMLLENCVLQMLGRKLTAQACCALWKWFFSQVMSTMTQFWFETLQKYRRHRVSHSYRCLKRLLSMLQNLVMRFPVQQNIHCNFLTSMNISYFHNKNIRYEWCSSSLYKLKRNKIKIS